MSHMAMKMNDDILYPEHYACDENGAVSRRQREVIGSPTFDLSGMKWTELNRNFLAFVPVRPYGVLGEFLPHDPNKAYSGAAQNAPAPDGDTAIVDAGALEYISGTYPTSRAGGGSRAIYEWLGVTTGDDHLPKPVQDSVKRSGEAKFHDYAPKKVIHTIGVDFRSGDWDWEEAKEALAGVYKNVLVQFAGSNAKKLRLLPISGGLFSGNFVPQLPRLTAEGLEHGFFQLTPLQQKKVRAADSIEMCVYEGNVLEEFEYFFEDARERSEKLWQQRVEAQQKDVEKVADNEVQNQDSL